MAYSTANEALAEISRLLTWGMDDAKTSIERKTAMSKAQEIAVSSLAQLSARDEGAQSALARIRKVRDQYADQAKFADVEPAAWFREFVSRIDRAVSPQIPSSQD